MASSMDYLKGTFNHENSWKVYKTIYLTSFINDPKYFFVYFHLGFFMTLIFNWTINFHCELTTANTMVSKETFFWRKKRKVFYLRSQSYKINFVLKRQLSYFCEVVERGICLQLETSIFQLMIGLLKKYRRR